MARSFGISFPRRNARFAMQRTLVAAFDLRGLLGVDGRLPWTLPAELAHFRALTLGRPVVMGRSTFETLRRPLDGRLNIVLSTRPDFAPRGEGVCVVRSLEEAWARVERVGADGCSVIGGARVYEAALDVVDRMALTQVQHTFEVREGQRAVYFPPPSRYAPRGPRVVSRGWHPVAPDNAWAWAFTEVEFAR